MFKCNYLFYVLLLYTVFETENEILEIRLAFLTHADHLILVDGYCLSLLVENHLVFYRRH